MIGFLALGFLQSQTLDVDAAASLRESFTVIARGFEKAHPGVHVALNFAGSQQLAAQIAQGQPCDVFASADERTIHKVHLDQEGPKVFARNTLIIVGSARRIGLKFLANVKTLIVAAPQVPVGGYTVQMLTAATHVYGPAWLTKVQSHIVSQEVDVRAVLTKIELREADAGIVYFTDAREAGKKVVKSPIDPKFQPIVKYPIGTVAESKQAALAKTFEAYVLSRPGQKILKSAGFLPPGKEN